MADLTAAKRAKMPASQFAEPATKGYPMNDQEHARLAISGATRAYHAGNISAEEMQRIQNLAHQRLAQMLAG